MVCTTKNRVWLFIVQMANNMEPNVVKKGLLFVQKNPQLFYTLFLVVVIPLAFIVTSEQFLGVARKQNDAAERSRIGLLHDAFALFLPSQFNVLDIDARIASIAAQNQTFSGFYVVAEYKTATSTTLDVLGSLNKNEVPLGQYYPDPTSEMLMRFAQTDPQQSYSKEFTKNANRQWKTVRSVESPREDVLRAYIITDVSMSESDAVLKRNIRNAYILLFIIVMLIMVLLGRQARIVDYATLYKRLEEVDRMKDDFVSMAAHELRSPLTIIRGYVDVITSTEQVSPKVVETLSRIDGAAQDLNTLVTDILDVAKLQEGRMSFHFSPVLLSDVVGDVYRAYQKVAEEKGLQLHMKDLDFPRILVDKTRLKQVVVNLVGNAVKYTPSGSVVLSGRFLEGEKMVELRVSDTGLGLSADAQKRLFSKFFRVKSKDTESIPGTGLGLWITAEIVRQMKGVITVESIEGKGSDFIVKFPLA